MSDHTRIVGVDEYLGLGRSLFLGLQSILACNLFLGPIVIISATSMGVGDASELIALTFLACGIASIVQSAFFLRYPSSKECRLRRSEPSWRSARRAAWTSSREA